MQDIKVRIAGTDSISNTESKSKTQKNSSKIDFVEAAKIDIDQSKKLLGVFSFIG